MRRLPARPFGVPMALGAWLRFDAIRRAILLARPTSIIEIGTGLGAMSSRLVAISSYQGVERDPASFAVAGRRLGERVRLGDTAALGNLRADMLCAFEVLEHIEDDVGALREWASFLEPHGLLLLSVPADPALFGPDDEAAGHFRRYTRESLGSVLAQAGYDSIHMEATGAGMGQFLQWIRNRIARPAQQSLDERTAASGRWNQPERRWLAPLFYAAALPGRAMQYPFRATDVGRGLVALARRPTPCAS